MRRIPGAISCAIVLAALSGCGDKASTGNQQNPVPPEHQRAQRSEIAAASTEPVELPKTISVDARQDTAASVRNWDFVYLKRVLGLEFTSGGQLKRSEYRTISVRSTLGVDRCRELQFPFDPSNEQIALNKLEIRASDGSAVRSDSTAQTHGNTLNVPLRDLKPGCTVEIVVTRQLKAPNEIPFLEYSFVADAPVIHDYVFVRGDVNAFRSESTPRVKCDDVDQCRCWTIPTGDSAPLETAKLWLSDARLTWEGETKRYLNMLAPVLVPDPVAKAEAARLTAGISDPLDKLRALARYVQREYEQSDPESGERARMPRTCREIIERKCGDCKEQALLLHQLLSAVQIPSHLALLNAIGPIRTNMPTFYQFNHVIVAVAIDGKNRFIDCTEKGNEAVESGTVRMGGNDAFVLDPANPRFERIPSSGQ
jgi:hypothetical protein